jgi:hypothetical protein
MKYISSDLIKEVHAGVKEKGFWDKERAFNDIVGLIHSELSEALEFEREKDNLKRDGIDYTKHYSGKIGRTTVYPLVGIVERPMEVLSNTRTDICTKPDGLLIEMADVVLRVFDYIGSLDKAEEFIDIIFEKHEYNKTRPYKHGGKSI